MPEWLRRLMRSRWRTVATTRRSVGGDRMIDVCHGIVRIDPIRIGYAFDLQETIDGRRRWRLRLDDRRLARCDARRDPVLESIRRWVDGGPMPSEAIVVPQTQDVPHHATRAIRT